MTEFEVMTGVDSRLFGTRAFTRTSTLAPMVRNSFPKYLARKGYRTTVYYPVDGGFYNAAVAFAAYGMEEFIDGPALGLPADWAQIVDRDMVEAIVRQGAFERPGPFFYFISTTENHGPHDCPSDGAAAPAFRVRFQPDASAEQTCLLHEYLRRAESTSAAFERVAAELRAIEKRTGRPYVLLAYGDHQPWSFTDGRYSVAGNVATESGMRDFSAVRKRADDHVTLFHLQASAPVRHQGAAVRRAAARHASANPGQRLRRGDRGRPVHPAQLSGVLGVRFGLPPRRLRALSADSRLAERHAADGSHAYGYDRIGRQLEAITSPLALVASERASEPREPREPPSRLKR